MNRWFQSLPLQRKLVTLVLGVNVVSLTVAVAGFVVFDLVRFRAAAASEAQSFAQVIAQNVAAAVVFGDTDAAHQTLASVRTRPMIAEACVYTSTGALFASYLSASNLRCPQPAASFRNWRAVGTVVPITRNGNLVGSVYIARVLSDQRARVIATVSAGGLMLAIAGSIALTLAGSLQRAISRPIVMLADAARRITGSSTDELPPIPTPPDETGALVLAFGEMVRRVDRTTADLRAEIEQRRRMQAERESLLQREREASRLKDEFLAAVSHELRTPLNAILGWTQILANTSPTPQVLAKAIASLARNAQAQNRVIEDLLDVSRVIVGKLQLKLTAVDLRTVVESTLEVIEPMSTAKHIVLVPHVPTTACIVHGDHDRLRQVVWNLLSNAVKFTPAGGTVTVALKAETGAFRIVVSDTGIGIAPAFLPHVFERFRQADGSTTREHGGLGLGLAIVKELSDLHGGRVTVESDGPGRGATFAVTLPELTERPARSPAPRPATVPVPRLDGVSVLAVDDNADALDVVVSALGEAGAEVRTASSGAEALGMWSRRPPHILLCDLALPQMDGFEVLKRVHDIDDQEGRAMTRAIAVTAYASDEYRARCLAAGFHDHVVKPYDTLELVRAVAKAVANGRGGAR